MRRIPTALRRRARAIRANDPNDRVIAFAMYEGDTDIHRALSVGASRYLLKSVSAEELIRAVRTAPAGGRLSLGDVARRLAEFTPRRDLSAREVEVLRLIAKGRRNEDVARVIKRMTGTVKVHLKNMFAKRSVEDRTEAVALALQRGIIPPRRLTGSNTVGCDVTAYGAPTQSDPKL